MLVGRGVEDNQQGLVSMLLLAEALHACDITPELSLGLVFMADEECGNNYGLAHVLERHAALPEGERFLRADDFYIVPDSGSPTGADIEVAEKCLCWLKVDVSGVQCHASTPHKGRNAFDILHAKLSGEASGLNITRVEFRHHLIVRDSTGVPRKE